jgi:putative ABC transport system permease protein
VESDPTAISRPPGVRRARSVRGRALLLARLVRRDIRRHLAQAILLVLAIAAASATLTMALALNGVTNHPYAVTRAATKGPDVVGYFNTATEAKSLIHAAGVATTSGPYPMTSALLHFDGRTAEALIEGRSQAPVGVDQPEVLSGGWVRPGGVVLERTFAEALGVGSGERIDLNGRSLKVAGIAVTAAQPPNPNLCRATSDAQIDTRGNIYQEMAGACMNLNFNVGPSSVGLLWMTEPDLIALTGKANPILDYALNIKLDNPSEAQAFVDTHTFLADQNNDPVLSSWEGISSADALLVNDEQGVLKPGVLLLALLAIASVAVLVGRRLSEYARRVGLLKAVGGTPGVIAAVFLIENLVLALFAAVVGLVVGFLVSPLLTNPGAALIGTAGAPAISPRAILEVLAVAIVIALVATLVPAIRAARGSTIDAMNDVAHKPRRRPALIRISRKLPIPALFGLRLVARRPRRALLSAANIAVTVTGIVAVIAFRADVNNKLSAAGGLSAGGLSDPVVNRDEQMLAVITILLVTLAALNALFTTWATVVDARRATALMRALGARARQVSSGLVVAQVLSALPGAVIGVPLGLALFKAAVKDGTLPSPLWLVATLIGTIVAMAALTVIPARIASMQPIVEALSSEAT